MVEKEIWVYFLAYNLIRLLMAQSALLADVLPRQLSFKHTVQLWLTWGQQTQAIGIKADEELLFMLIAQKRVGNRPGRVEPRAVKQRPKPFPLLMERREQARATSRMDARRRPVPRSRDDRQFQVGSDRSRPEMCSGQGGGELDLHERGRGSVY